MDRRRYNAPTSNEVAGLFPDDNLGRVSSRDIIVRLRGGGLQRLSEVNAAYDGLHFVLMHPYGEPGWHPNIRLRQPEANGDDQIIPDAQAQAEEDFLQLSQVM